MDKLIFSSTCLLGSLFLLSCLSVSEGAVECTKESIKRLIMDVCHYKTRYVPERGRVPSVDTAFIEMIEKQDGIIPSKKKRLYYYEKVEGKAMKPSREKLRENMFIVRRDKRQTDTDTFGSLSYIGDLMGVPDDWIDIEVLGESLLERSNMKRHIQNMVEKCCKAKRCTVEDFRGVCNAL